MKQCPNPNCTYYTRLEELPDAYVRCPSCASQLVPSGPGTGGFGSSALNSGTLGAANALRTGGLSSRNLDAEFDEAFAGQAAPLNAPAYAEEEYYPYEQALQYDDEGVLGPPAISPLARLAYIAGGVILVISCGLFLFVLFTRIVPQGVAVGPSATQTALAALRPAVNTPVAELPTAAVLPTQAPSEPTAKFEPPTSTPQPQPQPPTHPAQPPTEAPQPLPATSTPPPPPPPSGTATAPPPQQQPTGGVLDAFMTTNLQSGAPADRVSSYGPSDAFVLAVQARFGPGGVTSVRVRWYGPDGALLYELPRDYAQEGTYYSTFTLRKNAPWLAGSYRADIHTNGSASPSFSVPFEVRP